MTVERTINGYIRVSTIHNGYLVSQLYIGYSKSESLRLFKQYIKSN